MSVVLLLSPEVFVGAGHQMFGLPAIKGPFHHSERKTEILGVTIRVR